MGPQASQSSNRVLRNALVIVFQGTVRNRIFRVSPHAVTPNRDGWNPCYLLDKLPYVIETLSPFGPQAQRHHHAANIETVSHQHGTDIPAYRQSIMHR